MRGIKTATCGMLWEYKFDHEPVQRAGDWSVVMDGAGRPRCIIETTAVTTQSFNTVDARFAYEEGEGDRSLGSWREEHWRYFSRRCAVIGRTPDETMPLVCERFRVVWKPEIT